MGDLLSHEKLLPGSSDEDYLCMVKEKKPTYFGLSSTAFRIHVVLTLFYISTSLFILSSSREKFCVNRPLVYSPLEDAVEWEIRKLEVEVGVQSPYIGMPSYDSDKAWHDLFEHSNIRITPEELARLNRTSILLDSGHYWAYPDVFHQLHCLKSLRHYIYPDYYRAEIEDKGPGHIDHCIENLRQNIMCKADLAVLTLDWVPGRAKPKPNFSFEHECVNWDRIMEWTKKRSFDVFEDGVLVRPDEAA